MVHVRAGKAHRTSVPHQEQIATLRAAACAGPVFQRRDRDEVMLTAQLRAASVRGLGWGDLRRTAHGAIVAPPHLGSLASLRPSDRSTDRHAHQIDLPRDSLSTPPLHCYPASPPLPSPHPPTHASRGIPAAPLRSPKARSASRHTVAPLVLGIRVYVAGGSATLGRELPVRSLPHGSRRLLIVKSGQCGARRRPHITACRDGAALRAGSLEECVDIVASYAEGAPDA